MPMTIRNAWRVSNPGPLMVADGPIRAQEGPVSEKEIAKWNEDGDYTVIDSYRGMNPSGDLPKFNRVVMRDAVTYLAHIAFTTEDGTELDIEQ